MGDLPEWQRRPGTIRPAPVARRAGAAPLPAVLTGLGPLLQAGNRAVVQLLRDPSVQRDPVGSGLRLRDEGPRLHLDPEIEAQIRAIQAMRLQLAPEPVRDALLALDLSTLVPVPGPSATGPPPAAVPAATPAAPAPGPPTRPGPAPGTGLVGPRSGSGGDIWKAVMAEPSLGPAITALGDRAAERASSGFSSLSRGGQVAVVSGSVLVGGAAVTAILANRDARQWITSVLNDKIIPVPRVQGLGVQLNLSGPNVIVGLHLDVGQLLPSSVGFGPASETTPLGAPPPPYTR